MPLTQSRAQAQRKPVAMLSVSSIDAILGNVQYLTDAAGAGELGEFATMMANPYMQGMDRTKPIGMVLTTNGEDFLPLAFVPVKDLDATLSILEEQVGTPRELGNGIKEIAGIQPVFIKEQKGWAFIGQTVESLGDLPENPVAMLNAMPQDYDFAIRGKIQNVPKVYLDMAVNTLKDSIKQGLEQLSEEDRKNQEDAVLAQMNQFETFIKESDEITIGWKTEADKKRTYLDLTFTAVPGGTLAEKMSAMANAKSDFTGFLRPDAAMTLNLSSEIPEDQIQASIDAITSLKSTALREIEKDDDLKSPEARKAAGEILTAAIDILVDTIKTGKFDGGASVVLAPNALTALGGFHVAEGKDVEAVLRRVADMAKDEPDFPGINFNVDKQGDIAFHTMTIPIPEEEDARKLLGDTLEIAVGTGKDSAYFGFGHNCVAQLKSIISSQPAQQPVPPFQMTMSLKPIMQFVSAIEDNPLIGSVKDALDDVGTKDHVKIQGLAVKDGVTYRLEVEEGVLRAIGEAVKMSNAGGF
jgi:hypothetical protein